MQRIASLDISGSREGGVRSGTGTYVGRTIPRDRQVQVSRGKIGNSRYTLPSLPGGTCLEAETRTMFPDRPMERLRVSEADRVDFDESLLP